MITRRRGKTTIFLGALVLLMQGAMNFLLSTVQTGADGPGLPYTSNTERFLDQFTSPAYTILGVLIIFIGLARMYTDPLDSEMESPAERPVATPALNDQAQTALANVQSLERRFRALPDALVALETRIEFDAITARHLPDLVAAHCEARASVPDGSTDADALDRDYALSLDRLAGSMEHLLDACEEVGRARLEVQSRFIEARHTNEL